MALCLALLAALTASQPAVAQTPVDGPRGAGILVKFVAGTTAAQAAGVHAAGRGVVREALEEEAIQVVDVPEDGLSEALASYRADPLVRWAEPNRRVELAGRPNDPFFPGNADATTDLWGLTNTGQHGGTPDADIDAAEGWDLVPAGGAYTVGVIDTGVAAGHEDLAGRIVAECLTYVSGNATAAAGCADDNGHGTHVTGTIAANSGNGVGVAGVAPGARVLMCKALDSRGAGHVADIAACINDMANRAAAYNLRVISMSLGGGYSMAEQAAVQYAADRGVLVVAAAGNDGDGRLNYPAAFSGAVSVAATDRNDARASFSNANDDVEISAPGVSVVSTVPSGYGSWNGTSMATPHVAAAAAVVARAYDIRGAALRDRLARAADDLGAPGRDPSFGHGRLNLCRALDGPCGLGPAPVEAPAPSTAPAAPARAAAPKDRAAPRLSPTLLGRYSLSAVKRSGIEVRCKVSEAATCRLTARLEQRAARRAGMRIARASRSIVIAEGKAVLAKAGSATVTARLSSSAMRALKGSTSHEFTLRLTATDRAGNRATLDRTSVLAGQATSRGSR